MRSQNYENVCGVIFAMMMLGGVVSGASGSSIVWDPIDTHEWIPESFGGNPIAGSGWVDFQGRRSFQVLVGPGPQGYAVVRTKRFLLEDWDGFTSLQADIYVVGANGTHLKFEPRGATFNPPICPIHSSAIPADQWHTVSFPLPAGCDLGAVGSISFVIENVPSTGVTFYLDNLRLVQSSGVERSWDVMDDARLWFYFGNWKNWSGVPLGEFPGIEPISSLDGSPDSPTASLYLQWDFANGQDPGLTNAEIGTNALGNGLNEDFSNVDRFGMWVRGSSTEVAVRVFFFDFDAGSGFATPSAFLKEADTWQQIIWSIPWPTDFDRADVDEIKLVVDGIDGIQTGWMRFDHITLHTDEPASCPAGLVTSVINYDDQNKLHTQLGGSYGKLDSSGDGHRVDLPFNVEKEINMPDSQAALQVDFRELSDGFVGFFNSLLGRSDFKEFVLDLSPWECLRFYVRGSGNSTEVFNVKVEIKESRPNGDSFNYTAYTYIRIDDSTTEWQEIVLDLDLTNKEMWSYNQFVPDRTRMKELAFVLENFFNPESGTFYIDDMALIDTDVDGPPIDESSSDEDVLEYFRKANFNYFLHAVHPDTGLVLDRLPFSDLATIAGTGFGLAAWAAGAETGLITRDKAYDLARLTLSTLANAPMGFLNDPIHPIGQDNQIGVEGFFYHFLDSRTGLRRAGSELSSVDTTLCLLGVIVCKQAMTEANGYSAEQEMMITELADRIVSRVNWPFMLRTDVQPEQVYLGWAPECGPGFIVPHPSGIGCVTSTVQNGTERIFTWDYTTDEVLLIAILGLAAPDQAKRLPLSVMTSFARVEGSFGGHTLLQSFPGPAFTYQFANLWLPLAQLPCDVGGTNWWQNARKALWANHLFCTDTALFCTDTVMTGCFETFDGISFGLTACEDPTRRYKAFGAPPSAECNGLDGADAITCFLEDLPDSPNRVNGTLAIYGAASSIGFLPEETIAALRHYYFDLGLWNNLFGFPDAYHLNIEQLLAHEEPDGQEDELDPGIRACLKDFKGKWWNSGQFAIDQGPIVLALTNHLHGGLIQEWLSADPDVSRALASAFSGGACEINAVFEPPITNPNFVLKDGRTLPIKFHLEDADGNAIAEERNVRLEVTGPDPTGATVTYDFDIAGGLLRYDATEEPPHYIANFRTRTFPVMAGADYAVVVYEDGVAIGTIEFSVTPSRDAHPRDGPVDGLQGAGTEVENEDASQRALGPPRCGPMSSAFILPVLVAVQLLRSRRSFPFRMS